MTSDITNIASIDERNRLERDKRIRADGNAQYRSIDVGSEFDRDPFVVEANEREPKSADVEVLIVGGGFSGLLSAVHLSKQGIDDFLLVEKGSDVGGTWYWNRYPGARCDIESYIYIPLLEETGFVPTERYALGTEIFAQARAVADKFEIYSRALLQTRVESVVWDASTSRWNVTTDKGDTLSAHYVIMSTGGLLHRAKLPGIPGISDFEGRAFHTSRWDFEYTGGDTSGNLVKLRDQRVAVVGTGSTGLQVIPEVAKWAEQVFVVQRTPTAVDHRNNVPTDADWSLSLDAGWQERRMRAFESLMMGAPEDENYEGDQWAEIWGAPRLDVPADGTAPDMDAFMARMTAKEYAQMERIRARVESTINDPATAEALKPWYGVRCKRPSFNDDYLEAFNRSNVTLVNTDGKGIERITSRGVVVAGEEIEVDLIVYATGFEFMASSGRAGGFTIQGRDGLDHEKAWADGIRTVHGICSSGFPNMFTVGNLVQSGAAVNALYTYGKHAEHVAEVVRELIDRSVRSMEVTVDAEMRWAERMAEKSAYNEKSVQACTPSGYNNEGKLDDKGSPPLAAAVYGGGPFEYFDILKSWRENDIEADSDLTFYES